MSEIIFSVTKILLTVLFIKWFGFLYGSVLFYLMFVVYRYIIMKYIFGLEMLGSVDRFFVGSNNKERINIISIATFETFDVEKIKQAIIDRIFKKVKKFRMKFVKKFGNFYWREVTIEEAISRIVIIKDDKINTYEDVIKYCEDDINIHVNCAEELPYQIKLIPHGENGSALFKLDHMFSDGLGIVSGVCCLADNYDINLFPPLMRNMKTRWYHDLLDCFFFLIYGFYVVFYIVTSKKEKSPFRINTDKTTGICKFAFSKHYDLDKFAPIRKKLNLSFNELMMCVLARAAKGIINTYKGEFNDTLSLKCFIPIGKKGVPERIEDVHINNEIYGMITSIPVIDDIKKESDKVVKVLKSSINNIGFVSACIIFAKIGVAFLSKSFQNYIAEIFVNNIDLLVSNVPGPISPLYYAGCKMTMITSLVSTRNVRAFLPIVSYNKQFRFMLSVDVESGIDHKEFLRLVDEELDSLVKEN